MNYIAPCECGRNVTVGATQAGSTVLCECGCSLTVPSLSELRASAGQTTYAVSTLGRIRRMIRDGELPCGDLCTLSGRRTKDTFVLRVECERVWTRGSQSDCMDRAFFGFLFFGWLGAIIGWGKEERRPQELGRKTTIEVPLRVCSEFHGRLARKRRQRYLKNLLRQVPVYAALLDEYPQAVVLPVKPA